MSVVDAKHSKLSNLVLDLDADAQLFDGHRQIGLEHPQHLVLAFLLSSRDDDHHVIDASDSEMYFVRAANDIVVPKFLPANVSR